MKKLAKAAKRLPVRARVIIFGIPGLCYLAVLHTASSVSRVWDWRAPTIQESFCEWKVVACGLLEAFKTGKEIVW